MSHSPTCRTWTYWAGDTLVHHSEPDPTCDDQSHRAHYTEETK